MADNEKDLQLNIGANIDDFLSDVALMDKEYQSAVKAIESKKAEVRLQATVDISGANATDDIAAQFAAKNKEIADLMQLQRAKTDLLKKAWDELKNSQESSNAEINSAFKAYQKAQIELNKLQTRQNNENKRQTAYYDNIKAAEEKAREAEEKAAEQARLAQEKAREAEEKAAEQARIQREKAMAAQEQAAFDGLFSGIKNKNHAVETEQDKYIAIAKASGNADKVRAAEMKKLVTMYNTQMAAAGKLAEAYRREVSLTGENSERSQRLRLELDKQVISYKNLQVAIKSAQATEQARSKAEKTRIAELANARKDAATRQKMNALYAVSPEIAYTIDRVKSLVSAISMGNTAIAGLAPAIGAVAGGLAVAGAAAGGFYLALKKINDGAVESARSAMEAGDAIYYLKERLSVNDEDATFLQGVFKLDGSDIGGVLKALQGLDKALLQANEDGTKASQALAKYGESLTNSDGSLKNVREQLEAIARAYNKALEAGNGYQLLTETGLGKFSSLIAGWDGYVQRVSEIVRPMNEAADKSHAMADATADLGLQVEQVGKVWGNALQGPMKDALKFQQRLKANQVNFENAAGNPEKMKAAAQSIGELHKRFSALEAVWDRGKVNALFNLETKGWFSGIKSALDKVITWAGEHVGLEIKFDEPATVADFKKMQDNVKKQAKENPIIQEVNIKAKQTNDKIDKQLRDLRASDYERELYRIQDEMDAYRTAGADKLKVEELYLEKKRQLDDKYANKNNTEIETARKAAESRVQAAQQAMGQIQAVWQTETQKRIAEIEKQKQAWIKAGADEVAATQAAEQQKRQARMAEAERTMTQYKDVIRKLQKEEALGGDYVGRVQEWLQNRYMKQNGLKMSDFAGLQRYGVDFINSLNQGVKDKLYGGFAGGNNVTNNNNTTVNIDRPVLTDESLINQLVDRVADKLVPVAEKAFGQSANAY